MAEQFTTKEFEEEAATLKTLKEWNEGVRPSWRVFAALRIAAEVMRPGVIEDEVHGDRDVADTIRKALTAPAGTTNPAAPG